MAKILKVFGILIPLVFSVQSFAEKTKVENKIKVLLETNYGDITLELDKEKAPITVENFLSYADSGFYDGTIFHRVIDNFMVQGGGFNPDMSQKKTNAPIKNEAKNGLANEVGTVAMARTNVVDSATAQFFINVNNNDFLDNKGDNASAYGYAVFGKVVEGMPIVNRMKAASTTTKNGFQDVPKEPIIIKKVKRL
jgi:cyclophilin family peptidyl-prolyl cis-trans isomerase